MPGSEPLRVLLVSPCFGAYGGMEAFVLTLARELGRDDRFAIRVIFKRTRAFRLEEALARAIEGMTVEFCERASRALWKAAGWADVVHGQNGPIDIAISARVRRRPLALTIHNTLPARPLPLRWSWLCAARLADERWYNSRFVWRTWEPAEPWTGSRHVPTVSQLPVGTVDPDTRRGFVFLGRLVARKGADLLLDAYRAAGLDADAWPLTICGDGPMRQELETRSTGLRGVRFAGFVDGDAKARALAQAKWLVAPSHWEEPFGLVAIEARHLGVPCIASRDGGLPEAAGRDALLCEPGDVRTLAEALAAAARMHETEYRQRAARTALDLQDELLPLTFYAEAYRRLAAGGRA